MEISGEKSEKNKWLKWNFHPNLENFLLLNERHGNIGRKRNKLLQIYLWQK